MCDCVLFSLREYKYSTNCIIGTPVHDSFVVFFSFAIIIIATISVKYKPQAVNYIVFCKFYDSFFIYMFIIKIISTIKSLKNKTKIKHFKFGQMMRQMIN